MSNSTQCSCHSCVGAACQCGCQNTKSEPKATGCSCASSVQVRPLLQVQGGLDGRDMPRIALRTSPPAESGPMRGIHELQEA